jgi:hypothetical protein
MGRWRSALAIGDVPGDMTGLGSVTRDIPWFKQRHGWPEQARSLSQKEYADESFTVRAAVLIMNIDVRPPFVCHCEERLRRGNPIQSMCGGRLPRRKRSSQ